MEQISHDRPPIDREATQAELDALVIDVVQRHAASLLRLSRRHSLCADDAEDAYQRGLEIFIKHAPRLDPERAPAWLRTVVKHEAMAVRRTRQRDLAPSEIDFDQIESDRGASPEERALGFEQVAQSAEALQRLKPQEVRALWLRAQGNSYDEIGAETGWSRTKVNRCLYEGRRAFISRYAGIESGEECKRWEPMLSALVDGEATNEQLVDLRPHLRQCGSCRGVVREMHRSSAPLAVVFPLALLATAGSQLDEAGNVFIRTYESFSTWATERSASSLVRAQIVTESVVGAAGKATAVVAATAAAASGSAVALDQVPGGSPSPTVLAAVSGHSFSQSSSGRSRAETAARRSRQQARRRARAATPQVAEAAPAAAPVVVVPTPSTSSPAASEPQSTGSAPASAEMGLE